MKFGPGRKTDLLSPEEREIVDRFERGVIDAAEAGRLLIATTRHVPDAAGDGEPDAELAADGELDVDPNETPEEAAARRLVEQIARDVYESEGSS
jgi:hypothetical protein